MSRKDRRPGRRRSDLRNRDQRRSHDKLVEQAERLGYRPVEYSLKETTLKHEHTGATIKVPTTSSARQPRDSIPVTKWYAIQKAMLLGATNAPEE